MPTKAIKQRLQARYIKWTILALIVLGTLGIIGRLSILEKLSLPEGDTVWTISIKAQLKGAQKKGRVIIAPPISRPQVRIVSQNLQHTGMRLIRTNRNDIRNRNIVLQVINPGDLSASAVFNVHIKRSPQINFSIINQPLDEEKRALYLSSEENINLNSHEIITLLEHISKQATDNDTLLDRIFLYTNKHFVKDNKHINNDIEISLRTNKTTALGRSRIMVALCRASGIPARVITGFILEESYGAVPHYWLEVYSDDKWIPYAPEKGYAGKIPSHYLAFNRDNNDIVTYQNIADVKVTYLIQKNYDLTGLNIFPERRAIDILNLERFPPETRNNLGLLLLLPMGALITAFCRHFLGIRGYGTFTPTLLALSVVYAGWITALVLLSIVIALGLSGRSAMPDKLSRITRLAVVFTIVAMSMVLGVSLIEYFDININEHVMLLPIVILTSLIDRFYSAAEDYGIYIAMRRMIWTIIMGLMIYPILRLESVGAFLLVYPETHFFTLAMILLLSMYNGMQLSEFGIFNWIKEPASPKQKKLTPENHE